MKTDRGFVPTLAIIIVAALVVGGGYYVYQLAGGDVSVNLPPLDRGDRDSENSFNTKPVSPIGYTSVKPVEPVACTLEAKICPDGSAVGRTGPNCEFAACPALKEEAIIKTWKTHINSNPNFSFEYPSSWDQPKINQQSTRVFLDFGNGFSVTHGLYYDQQNGRNLTVLEIINGYKKQTNLQDFKSENIKIDEHIASRLTYKDSATGANYIEVYISQDQQIQEKFINLNANIDSIDLESFNHILSTFRFIP